ncbi:MAG: hypothetical protein E6600_12815 [Anaerocolumna aminovalerica]|uniref:hypothetical protein n=1 Tax=Anaerocolumna aminovalerica TaxID=1527 RepID=UPI000BE44C0F|nr:hypothetical protein [Anaerocolumna aminovalerica]MBU5332296.1 hypothetical protein [Anaerocolumna aminovalerica]MDU6265372.1 hypothetical protein [Anaerocolumna aminovalerica]
MGHLGFSYIGLIFLLMLTIPNLIWTKHQPDGYDFHDENKVLLIFERIGQVLVTCTSLIFSDFNLRPWSIWTLWLVAAVILMLMYECWWIRYFKSPKGLADFYSSFCGVPVAGATLPVAAFLLLGIYGKVVWLIISVVILGIGHIGIHLQHLKEINQ